jgi:hypothetical protein
VARANGSLVKQPRPALTTALPPQPRSQGIDVQKAGLSAPLLVRNHETGQILVNLDRDIMTLIREAKYLQQMGVSVPESARLLLLQVGGPPRRAARSAGAAERLSSRGGTAVQGARSSGAVASAVHCLPPAR